MSEPHKHSVTALQNELYDGLTEVQRNVLNTQRTAQKRLDQLLSEVAVEGLKDPEQIRAVMMQRHGLDATCAEFMADLATRKTDPAAVHADKAVLKGLFGYLNYGYDLWEILLRDLDRPFFGANQALELSYYATAAEFLQDCYYEKGALEPMVRMYSAHTYKFEGPFKELLGHLEKAGRGDLVERLWTGITRRTRAKYFFHRPEREHGAAEAVDELKGLALEAYDKAVCWMERMGRTEAIPRFADERAALAEDRIAELAPVSEPRKMDEATFWDVLSKTRAAAPNTLEQLAVLGETLRGFSAPSIKKFGALYAKAMKSLYHWNVWALAYAARGGCSDDAFEEFRTWLILQGDPALLELAIRDPAAAAERVPADPDLPDGSLLFMIEEAYRERGGPPMELPSIDLEKPKGRFWREENLGKAWPGLVAHYG